MKKMMISIACVTIAGTVLAGPEKNFARFDTDKDGFISKTEFMAMRATWDKKKGQEVQTEKNAKMFARKDANKDGKLTLEEFGSSAQKK